MAHVSFSRSIPSSTFHQPLPAAADHTNPVVSDYSADRSWWREAIALRGTVVVTEKTTDALTPPNGARVMLASGTVNQVVAETLVIALVMIVRDELGERATEVPLTERNDAVQAFLFD